SSQLADGSPSLSLHGGLPIDVVVEAAPVHALAVDLRAPPDERAHVVDHRQEALVARDAAGDAGPRVERDHVAAVVEQVEGGPELDRKSTRLNSSHVKSSYAVF